ncbi:MAG: hypothetical protein ACOYT8_05100 [Candidatus Dependentiae bacterium]
MKYLLSLVLVISPLSSINAMNKNSSFIKIELHPEQSLYPKCENIYEPWDENVCGYWSMNRRLDEYDYSVGYNDSKCMLRFVTSRPYIKKCIYGKDHPSICMPNRQNADAKKILREIRVAKSISPSLLKTVSQKHWLYFREQVLYQVKDHYYQKVCHENEQYHYGLTNEKMPDYYRPCKTYYERKNWYYFQKKVLKELPIKYALGIIKQHFQSRPLSAGNQSIVTTQSSTVAYVPHNSIEA